MLVGQHVLVAADRLQTAYEVAVQLALHESMYSAERNPAGSASVIGNDDPHTPRSVYAPERSFLAQPLNADSPVIAWPSTSACTSAVPS